ncbi:hypothetical protein ACHAWF_002773 [Thalassiosira exigua]
MRRCEEQRRFDWDHSWPRGAAEESRFPGGRTPCLASKITDDVLAQVLECIDAKANLKQLNLAGCVNITGVGLNPLLADAKVLSCKQYRLYHVIPYCLFSIVLLREVTMHCVALPSQRFGEINDIGH